MLNLPKPLHIEKRVSIHFQKNKTVPSLSDITSNDQPKDAQNMNLNFAKDCIPLQNTSQSIIMLANEYQTTSHISNYSEDAETLSSVISISVKPERTDEDVAYGIQKEVIPHHTYPYYYDPNVKMTMRSTLVCPYPSRKINYCSKQKPDPPKTSFTEHILVKGQQIGSSKGSDEIFSQFSSSVPTDCTGNNSESLENEGGTFYLACDILLSSTDNEDSDYELFDYGCGPASIGRAEHPYIIHSSEDCENPVEPEKTFRKRKATLYKSYTRKYSQKKQKNSDAMTNDKKKRKKQKNNLSSHITHQEESDMPITLGEQLSEICTKKKPKKKKKRIDTIVPINNSDTAPITNINISSPSKHEPPKDGLSDKNASNATNATINGPINSNEQSNNETPQHTETTNTSCQLSTHDPHILNPASKKPETKIKKSSESHTNTPISSANGGKPHVEYNLPAEQHNLHTNLYNVANGKVIIPFMAESDKHKKSTDINEEEKSVYKPDELLLEIQKIIGHKSLWPVRIYNLYISRRLSYMNTFIVAIFGYINNVPLDLINDYLHANRISKTVRNKVVQLYEKFKIVPDSFKNYYSFNIKQDRLIYLKELRRK